MVYDRELAERIRSILKRFKGVGERRMYGGLAFLHRGNLCCGVVGSSLMVRVGTQGYQSALSQPHVRPMDRRGQPLEGTVCVDREGIVSDGDLRAWVERGLRFAQSLPAR